MNEFWIFVFGVLVGVIFMSIMMVNYNTHITNVNDALYECEQHIPRNQYCDYQVIAKPIEKD